MPQDNGGLVMHSNMEALFKSQQPLFLGHEIYGKVALCAATLYTLRVKRLDSSLAYDIVHDRLNHPFEFEVETVVINKQVLGVNAAMPWEPPPPVPDAAVAEQAPTTETPAA